MKHHIIVKWNDRSTNKKLDEIRAIFDQTLEIPGVRSVEYKENCIDRPNRYDLMIVIDMEPEALPAYDDSEPHHRWKQTFGPLMEKKAIFDCE